MLNFISELLSTSIDSLNNSLAETAPHQVILATAAIGFLYNQYHNPWISRSLRSVNNQTYQQRLLDIAYELTQNLPQVKKHLAKELDKNLQSTREKLSTQRATMQLRDKLPKQGLKATEILKQFDIEPNDCLYPFREIDHQPDDQKFNVLDGDGQDSGALYAVHPKELTELLKEVYGKTALTNPMHDKWPRVNAMQAEIIHWCQNLFNGEKEGYGLLTHGGTTSIIEAMAAYVMHARANHTAYPEIIVPETAHAAFKKAANLLGATLITVPVDPDTGAVTARQMRSYISRNTAVIVGSAPSFMNGIADPISDLGKLAEEYEIPLHVDACLGGFLTAFLDTSNTPLDFRVKGVTSISADLHKYGCCPKGTSVCLFNNNSPALSVYAALNWSGGLYVTPGILDGSTSGARVAEIYATLAYYGQEQYQNIAQDIIQLQYTIKEKVDKLDDIFIYGTPNYSVLGFRSNTLNSHYIADELDKRGWKLNLLQNPDGFHFCLTHVHTLVNNLENKFIDDLAASILAVKTYAKDRKASGNVKVYGAVGMMPTAVQAEVCLQYQKERLAFKASKNLRLFTESKAIIKSKHEQLPNNTIDLAVI